MVLEALLLLTGYSAGNREFREKASKFVGNIFSNGLNALQGKGGMKNANENVIQTSNVNSNPESAEPIVQA